MVSEAKRRSLRRWRLRNKERVAQQQRERQRRCMRTRFVAYLGAVTCPKCGKRGYKKLYRTVDIKTGHVNRPIEIVHHMGRDRSWRACVLKAVTC